MTELHLWMLACRAMREGPEGRYLRNHLVNHLWTDSGERLKKLKIAPKARNETLIKLGDQFRAALFMYDEVRNQTNKKIQETLLKQHKL